MCSWYVCHCETLKTTMAYQHMDKRYGAGAVIHGYHTLVLSMHLMTLSTFNFVKGG